MLDRGLDDVAGGAGFRVDDGDALVGEEVDECALADIRLAHDGYVHAIFQHFHILIIPHQPLHLPFHIPPNPFLRLIKQRLLHICLFLIYHKISNTSS